MSLWEAHPTEMSGAIADYEQTVDSAIRSRAGHVVKHEGDAVMAVFDDARTRPVRRAEDPDLDLALAWRAVTWNFWAFMGDREPEAAADALRHAVDLFEEAGGGLVGDALASLSTILCLMDSADTGDVAERAVARATTSTARCLARAVLATQRIAAGDLAAVGTAMRAAVVHAERCPRLTRCEMLTLAWRAALLADDIARAAPWSAVAPAQLPVFGSPFIVDLYRRVVAEVRAKLGRQEASRLRSAGRALTLSEAIAEIAEWADQALI